MVRLYVLTGFLGSGKTSVINSLLGHLTEQRVGLIVNDFGPIVVDSALVASPDSVVVTKSLSGGQIFCSCLSGKFVDSVEAMLPLGPDMIIVEASGLAKPAPLLE
ncbi:MAG: GTP-binding protein, partial [Sphaerochaetaceae bacterium]|nr:GTP-binding protein [Sphaerochaetaceae bacterium]